MQLSFIVNTKLFHVKQNMLKKYVAITKNIYNNFNKQRYSQRTQNVSRETFYTLVFYY